MKEALKALAGRWSSSSSACTRAPRLLDELAACARLPLVVHYDADLYASTLFALALVDRLARPYTAILDEFTGHETRALRNCRQGWRADIAFHGRVLWRGRWPQQVLCAVTPAAAPVDAAAGVQSSSSSPVVRSFTRRA